jgi:hypothetical protein
VFAHQADTKGMSESADLERFACHGAEDDTQRRQR